MKKLLLAIVLIVGCGGEANIDHDCSINGLGRAECVFTNSGNADGSVCIEITMIRNRPKEKYALPRLGGEGTENKSLKPICSGIVKAGDVVERQKTLSFMYDLSDVFCHGVNVLYYGGSGSWADYCSMSTKVVSKDQ